MSISKKTAGMGAALALAAAGMAGTVTSVSAGEGATTIVKRLRMRAKAMQSAKAMVLYPCQRKLVTISVVPSGNNF